MLSFIIPAYNEELLLGPTLAAVNHAAQALGQAFEVVVVDDASTDRTSEIAQEHGARVLRVDLRQIAATRNAGARKAKGDRLIFVDADTIVTTTAVRSAVEAMQAGAVGGGCGFRFDGRIPFYGRVVETAARHLYRILGIASGCFLFCTREAFTAVGGFNGQLFCAEEYAMSRALRRHGRFVVLRESVTTSGRKLRTYSAAEMLRLIARLVLSPRSARQRKGMEIWYGARRPDPQPAADFPSVTDASHPE